MKHLIDPMDLSKQEVERILALAAQMRENPKAFAHKCDGKKLATLFYEPSTRTRLSFEAAMLELGGSVLGFSEASSSSASKGESVADTIRTVQCYADVIAMRHPKEGSAKVASMFAQVPVINAGDGGHMHPTQTLTDLFTIKTYCQRLDNLTIGLCGDLMFGRTVHSLLRAMTRYENVNFVLISPPELRVPDYILAELHSANVQYKEVDRLEDGMENLDILYMTRVQRERFFNEADYIRLRDSYILDAEKMKLAPEKMLVMHPLPRVNEIATEVDNDPRAVYFKQALCGKFVRSALILTLLEAE